MQTTNDIFVNPSAIKTNITGKLIDDTEQVSGKKKKLSGVKREQNPPYLKLPKERKVLVLGYIYACNFVTNLMVPKLFRSKKHYESYVKLRQEYDSCEKRCPSTFRTVKKGEGLNLVRWRENS